MHSSGLDRKFTIFQHYYKFQVLDVFEGSSGKRSPSQLFEWIPG